MLRHSLIIVLLLLAGKSTLIATPLRFLPWDDQVAARKISVKTAAGITELKDLHPYKRSKAYEVAATEAAAPQISTMDRLDAAGKPAAIEIQIPAGFQAPLVLLIPDSKHATGLRLFVIEDDTSAFPWGTLRFINATGKPLLLAFEKSVTRLPAAWTPVDIRPAGAARNAGVQIAAQENTAAVLYSAVWEHDPDVRRLAFIVPGEDERTGALDLKLLPENKRAATPVVKTDKP